MIERKTLFPALVLIEVTKRKTLMKELICFICISTATLIYNTVYILKTIHNFQIVIVFSHNVLNNQCLISFITI